MTHETDGNFNVKHRKPKSSDDQARDSSSSSFNSFPKMSDAAFYGLPGEIVSALAPHTESDPVGLLLTLHSMFGNAIGRGPYYPVEGDRHGTNLFVLEVGLTAKARKGTGAGRIRQLFRVADEMWLNTRVQSGLSSGEGLIWEVRDPIVRMNDGQEQEIDHGAADKRLLILQGEFAGTLVTMGREGNILSHVTRDAWDGHPLRTLTKNSPARAMGHCISIVGHITQDELRRYLTKTEMGNGFGNRFLFTCVRRARELPFGGKLDDQRIQELGAKIAEKIRRAKSIDRVTREAGARRLWKAVYHDLSEGRPGLLGALTARAEAQVVRLALLYALWGDPPSNGHLTELIMEPHLRTALAVWEYCEQSVRYLFGETLGDPVADTLLQALKLAGDDGLTRSEISGLFQRNRSADEIGRALEELSRLNLARAIRSSKGTGRPRTIPITRSRSRPKKAMFCSTWVTPRGLLGNGRSRGRRSSPSRRPSRRSLSDSARSGTA
jgi:hypothetical protein